MHSPTLWWVKALGGGGAMLIASSLRHTARALGQEQQFSGLRERGRAGDTA